MRKLLAYFALCVCVLVVHCRIHELHKREVELPDDFNADDNLVAVRDQRSHDLHKRGVFGFIARALTWASTGNQLWTAVSKGCNYFPSICKDREEIRRLEDVLAGLYKDYDSVYFANKRKYLNLKESMINNQYILYYINDTVKKVLEIGDMVGVITSQLEIDVKTMDRMYASSNNSATLENLVGPFVFQLEEIEKRIKYLKNSQIRDLVIQRIGEIFFYKSIRYVSNVVARAKGNNHNVPANNIVNRLSSNNADLPASQRSFWQKTKSYFNQKGKSIGYAFKAVGADIKRKFGTTLPKNLKKWWKAGKSWRTFKTQFKKSFSTVKSRIVKVKTFLRHPKSSIKYSMKNYKFRAGQAFGLVMEGVATYIGVKHWEKLAEDLSSARKNYEAYHQKVVKALKEVKNERVLEGHWSDTIESFKDLVSNFKNITTLARENNVFSDIFGLTGIPVDSSDPFFNTDFNVVSERGLKRKQHVVINFFKANGKSLSDLKDKFKIHEILISETKDLAQTNQSIAFIYDSLKRTYKNFVSQVLVSYSSKLVKRDVVCTTSLVLPNKNQYDFYPLNEFRDAKCNISDSKFNRMESNAANKRDRVILENTVKNNVPLYKPSIILDIAKGTYSQSQEQRLNTFGLNLKEKDVVCEIATVFSERDSYMFYDLTQFRPDCSQVTDAEFTQMNNIVAKKQDARDMINISMKLCIQSNQCYCPSVFAEAGRLTVDQVTLLVEEYRQENKPTCSYVEVNNRCSWQC